MVLVVGYHSIPRVTNWCRMACPSHLLRADAPGSVAFLSVPIYAMTLLRRMFCRWHLEVLDLSGFGVGFKHPCHMLCEYIYIYTVYIYRGCGAKPQLGWSGSTNSFFSGLKPPSNLVTCFYWTWFGDSGFTLCICTVALLYPLCFTPSIPCLRYKTCKLWPACTKSYESLRMRLQFLGLWLEGWCYIICLCYILYKIYCNVILYNVFDMFDKLYTIHLRASIPSFFWGGQSWYHRNHLDRWWFPNAFLFAPTEWWTASWCATITTRKVWFEASSWAKREVSFVTKTWGRLKSNGLCFAWFIIKLESIISRYTHIYIYIL